MKSKIRPHLEFVRDESGRPGKIGVRSIEDMRPMAWHSKKSIAKYTSKLREELAFYEELYKQFCGLR